MEEKAGIVRDVYRLYTEEHKSIAAIARWLTAQKIPTQMGKAKWDPKTAWGILSDPTYKGTACFGKTEHIERKRMKQSYRKRAFSSHVMAQQPCPRKDWIEIPVPAIVSEEIFALAQERLERNKQFSARHTKYPTLLQGLLVCSGCGYSYYRTSPQTPGSPPRFVYYRCNGANGHRFEKGRVCFNRAVRQDYLDQLVWDHVVKMLEDPHLIQKEIDRRAQEVQESNPTQIRKDILLKDIARVEKGMDRLLDAYQEGLLPLEELRKRMPQMRNRLSTLKSELQSLEAKNVDREKCQQLVGNLENFLKRLRQSAETLDITERQRILRLVVNTIFIGPDTLTIQHSIPVPNSSGTQEIPKYLLQGGRARHHRRI